MENSKYRYEISQHNDLILEENLYLETVGEVEAIFERDAEGVYLCDELEGLDIENMNESLPLLSYISMFKNLEIIDRAMSFFLQIRVMNFDKPNLDREILVKQIEKDKERICNVIQSMGIDQNSLFLIDKLDAKLHPLLLRKIIELFTNKEINKGAARMLFTSHDLTTMSKEGGSKPRNDENYSKQYLEGRYGADPYFRQLKNWEVIN